MHDFKISESDSEGYKNTEMSNPDSDGSLLLANNKLLTIGLASHEP